MINLFRLGLELRDELTSAFQRCVIPRTKDHDDVDAHVSTLWKMFLFLLHDAPKFCPRLNFNKNFSSPLYSQLLLAVLIATGIHISSICQLF